LSLTKHRRVIFIIFRILFLILTLLTDMLKQIFLHTLFLLIFPASCLFSQASPLKLKHTIEKVKRPGTGDSVTHYTLFYENGEKKEEYFFRKGNYCDTLKRWDVLGEVWNLRVYTDTGYAETERLWDGTIEKGAYKKVNNMPAFRIINDSATWHRYTRSDLRYPYYVRTGTWKTIYANGQLASEGRYLPEQFDVDCPDESKIIRKGFDPKDWLNTDGTPFSGLYAGCTTYLKEGVWIYYNTKGEKEKTEFYKNGLLISKAK